MIKPLATVLRGVSHYHAYLSENPDQALKAPAWSGLTTEEKILWRERAAEHGDLDEACVPPDVRAAMDKLFGESLLPKDL